MPASLISRLGWLALLAACCPAVAGAAAGCAAAPQRPSRPIRASAGPSTPALPRSGPSPGTTGPVSVVPAIGGDPARLAGQLSAAETVLSQSGATPAALARQALIIQLACLRIATHPGWAGAVIARVAPAQRAGVAADLAATADLVALTPPQARLPPWRIVPAAPVAVLRAAYRAAQAATGVGWSYLAAINFVESDFGRIIGPSSAGAQGPMQFLPATWSAYGQGNIDRPRDAILAAARFLAAHGAPAGIGPALYAYNPSWRYVDAVSRYARQLRAVPAALPAYYDSQVIYRLGRGWVLLPPGYGTSPHARAVHLRL